MVARAAGEARIAAIVTVSDGVTHGTRSDESGEAAEALVTAAGFEVRTREVVPDERDRIADLLRRLAEEHALIVTTGGTGFGPRDVTPEATASVIDRDAPGLAELMRAAGLAHTPMAALSRGRAGVVGTALVLNLPGSPAGVRESLEAVAGVLRHAVELLAGGTGAHPTGHLPTPSPVPPDPARHEVVPWVEVKAIKVVSGSPPCDVGASMRIVPGGEVHGTLGCAEFDAAAIEAAAASLGGASPGTAVFHHDLGDIEVFIEPHPAPPEVAVVSATDVARILRSHLRTLGYHVVLVEPRRERVADGDEPCAHDVGDLDLAAFEAVVLTDHDAPEVTATLAAALRSGVGFVGVMGSRRHVAHHVEVLRTMGVDDDDLARIRSPLGLDIGGKDPARVALSIAAGIVAAANGRDGGWLDR